METTPALIDDERVRPDDEASRRLHPSAGLHAERLARQLAVSAVEHHAELDLPFVWVG